MSRIHLSGIFTVLGVLGVVMTAIVSATAADAGDLDRFEARTYSADGGKLLYRTPAI